MILGFGTQEKITAKEIIEKCLAVRTNDEQKFRSEVEKIENEYRDAGETYKKMNREEAPERYSYFWHSIYSPYEGRFFLVFSIHHINRRHPFSTDGWAMLATKWIAQIENMDNDGLAEKITIYREA